MSEMKKYIRCHVVEAKPMTRADYYGNRGWDMPDNEDPHEAGYFVRYTDGYESWCPKDAFEKAGRPIDGMTFGMALEAMKQGKKVSRKGWNGKGMYLWLLQATEVKKEWCHDDRLIEAMGDRETLPCLGTIRMFTATKEVLTGWLASQTDMLSEDWCIVE